MKIKTSMKVSAVIVLCFILLVGGSLAGYIYSNQWTVVRGVNEMNDDEYQYAISPTVTEKEGERKSWISYSCYDESKFLFLEFDSRITSWDRYLRKPITKGDLEARVRFDDNKPMNWEMYMRDDGSIRIFRNNVLFLNLMKESSVLKVELLDYDESPKAVYYEYSLEGVAECSGNS